MARFGVYLPNVAWEEPATPAELVDFAVAAEALGLDSLWVEDRFLHRQVQGLEALTTLAYVAARTSRVRLGTSILLVNLRNPLVVAKAMATLHYLSGGRAILGASLGGRPDEYPAAGVSMKTRVSRFEESLRAIRAFWGGVPPAAGRHFGSAGDALEPRPATPIPILIGGRHEATWRRIAALGDGWLASSGTTAPAYRHGWAQIETRVREAGRDPATIEPAKFAYIHVDDDTQRAFGLLSGLLPRYYAFAYDVAASCLYGPPERCAEGARALLDAGVRTLIFSPVSDVRRQLELVATRVVPLLG